MHPVLFEFFGIRIYSFGVMTAIGFVVAVLWLMKTNRRKGFHPESLLDLAFGLFVSGLIGARLFFVLLNLDWYQTYPLEIFQLQKGGLVAYGGFFLAVVFAIVFTRLKSIPFWEAVDLVAPAWILGLAFGRIGCFLNGCCYGKPSGSFLARLFSGSGEAIHPTQLYESAGLFLLFLGLTVADRRSLKSGRLFSLTLLGYATLRFVIEFFRGDQIPIFLNLTLVQWMGLASLLVAALIWRLRR